VLLLELSNFQHISAHLLLLNSWSPLQVRSLDGRHEWSHPHPSSERVHLARDAIGLPLRLLGRAGLLLLDGREGGLGEAEDVLRVHCRRTEEADLGLGFWSSAPWERDRGRPKPPPASALRRAELYLNLASRERWIGEGKA
jgi:hypothetical protein